MSIIVEFSIDRDKIALGRALAGAGNVRIELEQIVPSDDTIMPFFWVDHPDAEGLELSVAESEYLKNLEKLDTVGQRSLYRVEWTGKHEDLLKGFVDTEGTILEAECDGVWHFVLRFVDHDHVGSFYNYCTDHGISIRVDRVYTLTEEALRGRMLGLTNNQREAIVMALKRGYFDSPRMVEMEALADELGISQQAFSERLRRGNKKVLGNLFL